MQDDDEIEEIERREKERDRREYERERRKKAAEELIGNSGDELDADLNRALEEFLAGHKPWDAKWGLGTASSYERIYARPRRATPKSTLEGLERVAYHLRAAIRELDERGVALPWDEVNLPHALNVLEIKIERHKEKHAEALAKKKTGDPGEALRNELIVDLAQLFKAHYRDDKATKRKKRYRLRLHAFLHRVFADNLRMDDPPGLEGLRHVFRDSGRMDLFEPPPLDPASAPESDEDDE